MKKQVVRRAQDSRSQVSTWLDEVRDKAAVLCADLKRNAADAKADVESHLARLERNLAEARARLDRLGEGETDAWTDLKGRVQSAWTDLAYAVERVLKRTKSGDRDA